MALVKIDTSFIDPLSELEAHGLVCLKRHADAIVPVPTQKFYIELEELLNSTEFECPDLVDAVHRIVSRYEPIDDDVYSLYMLMAMANNPRSISFRGKCINPAIVLCQSGITSLIELLSSRIKV